MIILKKILPFFLLLFISAPLFSAEFGRFSFLKSKFEEFLSQKPGASKGVSQQELFSRMAKAYQALSRSTKQSPQADRKLKQVMKECGKKSSMACQAKKKEAELSLRKAREEMEKAQKGMEDAIHFAMKNDRCNNLFCGPAETSKNCPHDCGTSPAVCGNGVCELAEITTCVNDCVIDDFDRDRKGDYIAWCNLQKGTPWYRLYCSHPSHPHCGNGIVEDCEECDDGNAEDGDGCSTECYTPCGGYAPDPTCPCSPFWTRTIDSYSVARDMALDQYDNVYAVGRTRSVAGDSDILLVKYDRCGNFRWSKTFGGTPLAPYPDSDGIDTGFGVTTDTAGNVYVTGRVGEVVTPLNSWDVVTQKMNSCGETMWTSYATGPCYDAGDGIIVGGGNVYTLYSQQPSCGSTFVGEDTGQELVIEKYSATDGSLVEPWAFVMPITNYGEMIGQAIALDSVGNLYVVSDYDPPIMGPSTENAQGGVIKIRPDGILDATFGGDGIVDRFDIGSDGSFPDSGRGIALASGGNIYITGSSWIVPIGSHDLFIAKFNSEGMIQGLPFPLMEPWARGMDIVVDGSENIYVAGDRVTPIDPLGEHYDFLVRKYNFSGEIMWTHTVEHDLPSSLYGIEVGTDGSVYVTGELMTLAGFGMTMWTRKYTPCGMSDDGPPDELFDPACL